MDEDSFTFDCSGRKINDAGYLGISESLEIATGYDQKISILGEFGADLSQEEKTELAKLAITRWAIYGNIELIW